MGASISASSVPPPRGTDTHMSTHYERAKKTYHKVFTKRFYDPDLFVEAQPVEELLT